MKFCKLPNHRNDCYLNSLVQLLLAVPGMGAAARAHLSMCGDNDAPTPACPSCVLSNVVADCDLHKGGYSDTASFVAAFEMFGIDHVGGSQEDVYVVLAAIMNSCADMMQPLFDLQSRTKVVCSQQRHSAVRDEMNTVTGLQLAMGNDGTLQTMLAEHLSDGSVPTHRCSLCLQEQECRICPEAVLLYRGINSCQSEEQCDSNDHACESCIGKALSGLLDSHTCPLIGASTSKK